MIGVILGDSSKPEKDIRLNSIPTGTAVDVTGHCPTLSINRYRIGSLDRQGMIILDFVTEPADSKASSPSAV
jgi:hypothetical protein